LHLLGNLHSCHLLVIHLLARIRELAA